MALLTSFLATAQLPPALVFRSKLAGPLPTNFSNVALFRIKKTARVIQSFL
eukprot:m.70335 g.70335  ORF g.70335 m.70335 type:complete len:51 (+) comp20068_c0_seq1:2560-2712(+)